ncbi:DUF7674 family protein [Roseivirga pacifica]|uniref:DUF7674 family protein n=1 Tax=Roseivirga pacifica TaxID=1267423 RepID=UPI002094581B|nr:hypothetical protein [Roseivirga pacifica]MCO6358805.1 hypothetical protein [Roseivirga pacifica]MCO6365559.1 hypothetical protein [Roseivirga pacifica]MCO6371711.1 hypothetical protein [Roseivirga pacifica]MCO6376178.1 hypothetical protein [Roseivirga pacifica]MCO6379089.1 hypothetical protein [Roseivirga pacifica]
MKSENWIDINHDRMSGETFFILLTTEFPETREEILEEDGNIHSQMEVFAEYTTARIKKGSKVEMTRCFAFIESKIDLLHTDLEEAIKVSYCESLILGEIGDLIPVIAKRMPKKLQAMFEEYQDSYRGITNQ